jgi:hypothetical protein
MPTPAQLSPARRKLAAPDASLVRQRNGDGGDSVDRDATAFDRGLLSARAINAIERIWGADAKRQVLLERDAYRRLRQARGVGAHSIAEIERAVLAWGFEGIGGKRALDESQRKRLAHRNRLGGALRDIGAQELLLQLAEICAERLAAYRQRLTRRLSRLHRAKCERAAAYYARCEVEFRRFAELAPARDDV